jgi:5-(carboxyamino)imidazole ribonucleotide synthase
MNSQQVFLPGSVLGVMGGGQLGRMFAIAARKMGYRIQSYSPETDSPTGQLADFEFVAAYDDEGEVRRFAESVDVLTFEFENIPAQTIEWCSESCIVRPSGNVLHIAQHRLREKEFLASASLPLAPFRSVDSQSDLDQAISEIGYPSVLKTAAFGYDGKGQRKIADSSQAVFGGTPSVLERFVPFVHEISVIVARGIDGTMETFPVCENVHSNHILDLTIVPARVPESVQEKARHLALDVAREIDLVGLLAVEMFALDDGELLINEIAPRPHNSGHFSFDACVTSQFEQQMRAVCGLPLGSTELLRPIAMANLLGDIWCHGEPNWLAAAAFRDLKIHLYGKSEPRPGRKMGHLLAFGNSSDEAASKVMMARAALQASPE